MNQAEYDQHVAYVVEQLITFRRQTHKLSPLERCTQEHALAEEIVQWVSSKPVPWWKRMYYALMGRSGVL